MKSLTKEKENSGRQQKIGLRARACNDRCTAARAMYQVAAVRPSREAFCHLQQRALSPPAPSRQYELAGAGPRRLVCRRGQGVAAMPLAAAVPRQALRGAAGLKIDAGWRVVGGSWCGPRRLAPPSDRSWLMGLRGGALPAPAGTRLGGRAGAGGQRRRAAEAATHLRSAVLAVAGAPWAAAAAGAPALCRRRRGGCGPARRVGGLPLVRHFIGTEWYWIVLVS